MNIVNEGSEIMNDLKEGIEQAIRYIEDNICADLEISEISKRAFVSPFYFQKIFLQRKCCLQFQIMKFSY